MDLPLPQINHLVSRIRKEQAKKRCWWHPFRYTTADDTYTCIAPNVQRYTFMCSSRRWWSGYSMQRMQRVSIPVLMGLFPPLSQELRGGPGLNDWGPIPFNTEAHRIKPDLGFGGLIGSADFRPAESPV